jgi:AcrR family transcriptional regulator
VQKIAVNPMTTRKHTRSRKAVRRTGGRSARVVEEVLRATLAELDRVGYAALRVEEVAARSGVNKTTIYRRWPTKAGLVAGAVHSIKAPVTLPDTGDLARDLTAGFVESLCRAEAPELRGVLRMVQTEREHPEVRALVRSLRETAAEVRRARLRASIARGELPADTDVELVQTLLSSAIFGPLSRLGERVEEAYVRGVIELVLAGVRAVGATGTPSAARPTARAPGRS